jgi:hypothetical protein
MLLFVGSKLLPSPLLSKNVKIKICGILSLTLKDSHRLRVFENTMLRIMLGPD